MSDVSLGLAVSGVLLLTIAAIAWHGVRADRKRRRHFHGRD